LGTTECRAGCLRGSSDAVKSGRESCGQIDSRKENTIRPAHRHTADADRQEDSGMNTRRLSDYHIHTAVSIDCSADLPAICVRASELGLAEIAVTNHLMVTNSDYCISEQQLVDLREQIHEMTKLFPDLTIRLGLEVDYLEGQQQAVEKRIEQGERAVGQFDFILGSVHMLRGVHFSSTTHAPALFEVCPPVEAFREYFRLLEKAVRSGMFCVMAHPDLIRKFTGSLHPPVPFDWYAEEVDSFIQSLHDEHVGIELNTKGLDCPVREIFPSEQLLERYINYCKSKEPRPLITLGSDAHEAENVGRKFDAALIQLKQAGGSELCTWQDRRPCFYKPAAEGS